MRKSLVAMDTDHIKGYVFGTDKLKEIRGASSLLDYLNRKRMVDLARSLDLSFSEEQIIYANGGSGLFVVDAEKADNFCQQVQQDFKNSSGDGATITCFVQKLPEDAPEELEALLKYPLAKTLALMRYSLRRAKDHLADFIAFPSHPYMRLCDSCGIEYVYEQKEDSTKDDSTRELEKEIRDPGEEDELYCVSCTKKRERDNHVKKIIRRVIKDEHEPIEDEHLWVRLLRDLHNRQYKIPQGTERPRDFNVFQEFKGGKDYFGLIYADANGMGSKIEECETLEQYEKFARKIDEAIYEAVCFAIIKHLKIADHEKPTDKLQHKHLFPFDILLLGGDDIAMVVPATVALDVASTLAKKFYEEANKGIDKEDEKHSLSVGVVLSPVKYPFGLLQDLVEGTLKFAKKRSSMPGTSSAYKTQYGDTSINFMTVTGSTSHEFEKVYSTLAVKKKWNANETTFFATLRPYNIEQLEDLLQTIRDGNKLHLGRSKLHEVREAVLKMNLTTAVSDALAVLRNWRSKQREFIVQWVYAIGGRYQAQYANPKEPGTLFPRVTFPWFAEGTDTYRTPLLDFVELYDFVSQESDESNDKN